MLLPKPDRRSMVVRVRGSADAIARLRRLMLDLAVRGKLVPQGYCNVRPPFGRLPVPLEGSWVARNALTFLILQASGSARL